MIALGFKLVRYADDFVVMCESEEEADRAIEAIKQILSELKLNVNAYKTGIVQYVRDHRLEQTTLNGFPSATNHVV